jgi:hypothetical protein
VWNLEALAACFQLSAACFPVNSIIVCNFIEFIFKIYRSMFWFLFSAEAETEDSNMNTDEFHKKLIEKIVAVLNSGSDEECPVCLEGLKTPVITHCAHLFCRTCIEQIINSDKVMNFDSVSNFSG